MHVKNLFLLTLTSLINEAILIGLLASATMVLPVQTEVTSLRRLFGLRWEQDNLARAGTRPIAKAICDDSAGSRVSKATQFNTAKSTVDAGNAGCIRVELAWFVWCRPIFVARSKWIRDTRTTGNDAVWFQIDVWHSLPIVRDDDILELAGKRRNFARLSDAFWWSVIGSLLRRVGHLVNRFRNLREMVSVPSIRILVGDGSRWGWRCDFGYLVGEVVDIRKVK